MLSQLRVSKELESPQSYLKAQGMGISFALSPCYGREERYLISLL